MIELRKWEMEDAEFLSRTLSNKKILAGLRDGIPYPYTIGDAKEYIEYILNRKDDEYIVFAIIYNHQIVGNICIERYEGLNRTAELGYYLDDKYWNKGICSEAVRLMCEYVFNYTDIHRIFAESFSDNIASCRVLEKNGFVFDSIGQAINNNTLLETKIYMLKKG